VNQTGKLRKESGRQANAKVVGTFRRHLPIYIMIIIFSGGFIGQTVVGVSLNRQATFAAKLFNSSTFLIAYVIAAYFVVRHLERARQALIALWPLAMLAAVQVLSVFWAVDVGGSIIDGFQFTMTLLTAVGVAAAYSSEDYLIATGRALCFLMLTSMAYIVFIPSLGLMSSLTGSNLIGLPQGVFTHKNSLADVASIGLFAAIASRGVERTSLRVTLFSSSLICLLISQSSTKVVAVLIALAAYAAWLGLRQFRGGTALFLFFLALGAAVAIVGLPLVAPSILDALGKDEGLTGRADLWNFAIHLIGERPFFGYGVGSIWSTSYADGATTYLYRPPHAHNVYIDQLLETGIIGLSLTLAFLACAIWLTILSGRAPSPAARFLFLALLSQTARSFGDSSMMRGNEVSYLLLAIAVALVALEHREAIAGLKYEATRPLQSVRSRAA
jgi:exopolysaccharide production protein ExoQ